MLLLATFAFAGISASSFATDAGEWVGGTVSGGVLGLADEEASFSLESMTSFSLTARVRVTDGTAISFSAGDATFSATYGVGGALTLGSERAPFPTAELKFSSDAGPVLVPGNAETNILDPEVVFFNNVYYLYYTAIDDAGLASVRVATSTDLATFAHADGTLLSDASAATAVVDGTVLQLAFARAGAVHFASSTDGLTASESTTQLSGGSDFDAAGLESPSLVISDSLSSLWYNAVGSGQAGYASSSYGSSYTRQNALTDNADRLFGLDVLSGPFGLEAVYTTGDSLGYALGGTDTTFAADSSDIRPLVDTNDAAWSDGGFGTPSVLRVGEQLQIFVAAKDEGQPVIGRFVSQPEPGTWATLQLDWDGTTATASWNGGPMLTTSLLSADTLRFVASGNAEIDEVTISYASSATDTGDDSGGVADTGTTIDATDTGFPSDTAQIDTAGGYNAGEWLGDPGGCGCNQAAPAAPGLLTFAGATAMISRFRRSAGKSSC